VHPAWLTAAVVLGGGALAWALIATVPRRQARALRSQARRELAGTSAPALLARLDRQIAELEAQVGAGPCGLEAALGPKDPSRSPAARLATLRRYRDVVAEGGHAAAPEAE
jgi:hypothetical protein